MAWNDGDGSGELLIENGKKKLTVKDREGKEIFSGPVDTNEQRKNLPPGVRDRLERIEKNVKVHVPASGEKLEL
jgi:serine protease Do